jgi:hypothetical protein
MRPAKSSRGQQQQTHPATYATGIYSLLLNTSDVSVHYALFGRKPEVVGKYPAKAVLFLMATCQSPKALRRSTLRSWHQTRRSEQTCLGQKARRIQRWVRLCCNVQALATQVRADFSPASTLCVESSLVGSVERKVAHQAISINEISSFILTEGLDQNVSKLSILPFSPPFVSTLT